MWSKLIPAEGANSTLSSNSWYSNMFLIIYYQAGCINITMAAYLLIYRRVGAKWLNLIAITDMGINMIDSSIQSLTEEQQRLPLLESEPG